MEQFNRGGTAIVAASTFGMGEAPGYTSRDLAAAAGVAALTQAGLEPRQVDGLFVCLSDDMLSGMTMAEYLGIRPRLTDTNRTGGSTPLIQLMHAALALDQHRCDVALIAYGSNQRTATGKLANNLRTSIYEAPYRAMSPISAYALAAARHMYQYGTTREQLGAVALAARQWARLNPDAFRRDELTMREYLAARLVSDPLGVRDCCLVTDGAAAIVMTRTDRAKDYALRPAYVLGAASATWHQEISNAPDLTVTAAVESGARAYAQARVRATDMDVLQIYDAFTVNIILFLEDLGFCPKGEGGRFVENGRIAPGGELAVNTNGGGLSCVHPGIYGLFTLVEASRQLAGLAGSRQIADAELALCHGNGGVLSSQATVILGTAATL
jgi:acetyl-CoA acetyltransferase